MAKELENRLENLKKSGIVNVPDKAKLPIANMLVTGAKVVEAAVGSYAVRNFSEEFKKQDGFSTTDQAKQRFNSLLTPEMKLASYISPTFGAGLQKEIDKIEKIDEDYGKIHEKLALKSLTELSETAATKEEYDSTAAIIESQLEATVKNTTQDYKTNKDALNSSAQWLFDRKEVAPVTSKNLSAMRQLATNMRTDFFSYNDVTKENIDSYYNNVLGEVGNLNGGRAIANEALFEALKMAENPEDIKYFNEMYPDALNNPEFNSAYAYAKESYNIRNNILPIQNEEKLKKSIDKLNIQGKPYLGLDPLSNTPENITTVKKNNYLKNNDLSRASPETLLTTITNDLEITDLIRDIYEDRINSMQTDPIYFGLSSGLLNPEEITPIILPRLDIEGNYSTQHYVNSIGTRIMGMNWMERQMGGTNKFDTIFQESEQKVIQDLIGQFSKTEDYTKLWGLFAPVASSLKEAGYNNKQIYKYIKGSFSDEDNSIAPFVNLGMFHPKEGYSKFVEYQQFLKLPKKQRDLKVGEYTDKLYNILGSDWGQMSQEDLETNLKFMVNSNKSYLGFSDFGMNIQTVSKTPVGNFGFQLKNMTKLTKFAGTNLYSYIKKNHGSFRNLGAEYGFMRYEIRIPTKDDNSGFVNNYTIPLVDSNNKPITLTVIK